MDEPPYSPESYYLEARQRRAAWASKQPAVERAVLWALVSKYARSGFRPALAVLASVTFLAVISVDFRRKLVTYLLSLTKRILRGLSLLPDHVPQVTGRFDDSDYLEDGNPKTAPYQVQDFELWKRIGKGGFGEVWMATKKGDTTLYAMKILDKEHLVKYQSVERAITEKQILQGLSHPFVISLKYAFQDETRIYLVLDYVGGGDMYSLAQARAPFTEKDVQFYAAELTLALEHLHSQGIIFRDLKLENILIGLDGHIVLTDFGVAKQSYQRSHTFVGTPHYMAPEILQNRDHGIEVDWWALGVVCYELLVGHLPFEGTTDALFPNVAKPLELPSTLSREAKSFLRELLEPDLKKRLGTAVDVKRHAFFGKLSWESVLSKSIAPPVLPSEREAPKAVNFGDGFGRFSVYDSSVDRNELLDQQRKRAVKAIHPLLDTSEDDIAELIAEDLIDSSAVFYLQGEAFCGWRGYLAYRRKLHSMFKEISLTITGSNHEGDEGGHRVVVFWELLATRVRTFTIPQVQSVSSFAFAGPGPGQGPAAEPPAVVVEEQENSDRDDDGPAALASRKGSSGTDDEHDLPTQDHIRQQPEEQQEAEAEEKVTYSGVNMYIFSGLKIIRGMNSYNVMGGRVQQVKLSHPKPAPPIGPGSLHIKRKQPSRPLLANSSSQGPHTPRAPIPSPTPPSTRPRSQERQQ